MLKEMTKHEDKEHGKTLKHDAPCSINHKATQNKNNTKKKPIHARIRLDLEQLNDDPIVISAFQTTTGVRFAPLVTLVYEDADRDSMVTHFNRQ